MTRAIESAAPRPPTAEACGTRLVLGMAFDNHGVSIEYLEPGDLKGNGVSLIHRISIPLADQYDEEIDSVLDAALKLLDDVLEDVPAMAVFESKATEDDTGMGE